MRSIRTKLIFWICTLFIFIGALIYLPLSVILPKMIITQILKRDIEIARFVSDAAKESLLIDDKIKLSLLLNDNLDKLEDAHYLFIQDQDGSIVSHTFDDGFPKRLLSFRQDGQRSYRVKEFLNKDNRMYDIAFPILKGELGALHLGVSLESDRKDIARITMIKYYIAAVILAGLGAGILVFLAIGFLFSRQIIRLKNFVSEIGHGDLEAKVDIRSKDEIGALASAFNEMVSQLKQKAREIERLNKIEERNRIALDLHDGCAQQAANIIKRVELCERLYAIDPPEAFKELEALKGSARETLNQTRRLIDDLKSPDSVDFNLLSRLKDHLSGYMIRNGIEVRLDALGPLDSIRPDKARSIFYIITEALANAKRHSGAKNIELYLDARGDGLRVDIRDDGRGFDIHKRAEATETQKRWGLIGMRERAETLGGILRIESALNRGTRIFVNIPLMQATS